MGDKITVGYCRVSSMAQEVSLARQEELIRTYCVANSLGVPMIIADEGVSGFKDSRPGFVKLLNLCEAGGVATILVIDTSRLSRSAKTTIGFFQDVVIKHRIRFISLNQQIDSTTPQGLAFIGMSGIFAQLYRDEVVFKTRAALDHKRSKGEKLGGIVPYGYSVSEDGVTLRIDPAELEVLMLIRRLKDGGMSLRGICRELARRGVPTKTGLPIWSRKVLRDLLKRLPAGRDGTLTGTIGPNRPGD